MDRPIVLCTDGSDLAHEALRLGLALLADPGDVVITTVIEHSDPSLVTGTGFAGGTMTPSELVDLDQGRQDTALALLEGTAEFLGLPGAELRVLDGRPGPAVCDLAEELEARAIVIGTRGRGGFKRALLGSVSDHIVRSAPCPVIVVGSTAVDDEPT